MLTAFVHIDVKPECSEDFLVATRDNHFNSLQEPGCLRFDVLRDTVAPNTFYLYEVYTDENAAKAHKATEHYARWNRTVAGLMASERHATKATVLLPDPWL